MLRFIALFFVTALRTLVARARRGPLLPTWSLGFEIVVRTLRRDWDDIARWPVQKARADLEARSLPSDAVPKVTRTAVRAGNILGEWVRGPDAKPRTEGVVLYLHGGSYLFGSPRTHADTIARVALATGHEVFASEYRLAPEHPYPAQLEDALATIEWLAAAGIARDKIVLAGESAGGNLVIATLQALRDSAGPTVLAGVAISPWLDLTASSDSYRRNADYDYGTRDMLLSQAKLFAGSIPIDDPRVSIGRADPAGMAPVFVQAGTAELLFDECKAWAERARSAGVDVIWDEAREMPHAPPFFAAQSAEGARAVDAIGRFVKDRLAASHRAA